MELNISNFNKVRNELLSDPVSVKSMDMYIEFANTKHKVNVTREELVDKIMLPIIAHESGLTFDPTIKQRPKKPGQNPPGRGLFQYEQDNISYKQGEHGSATSALVRASTVGSESMKKWANKQIDQGNSDFSKYSIGQQGALFIYDNWAKKDTKMHLVAKDVHHIFDYWATHHQTTVIRESNANYFKKRNDFMGQFDSINHQLKLTKRMKQNKQQTKDPFHQGQKRTLLTGDEVINNFSSRVRNVKRPPNKGNPGGLL